MVFCGCFGSAEQGRAETAVVAEARAHISTLSLWPVTVRSPLRLISQRGSHRARALWLALEVRLRARSQKGLTFMSSASIAHECFRWCANKAPVVLFSLFLIGQAAMAQDTGSIQGSVSDSSGAPVFGAVVLVEGADGNRHTTVTDVTGAFLMSSLAPGNYNLRVSASGFSDWTAENVPASTTPESMPLHAVLPVAPEVTTLTVSPPQEEVAAEQLH